MDHGNTMEVAGEAHTFSLVVTKTHSTTDVQRKAYEESKLKHLKAKNLLYQVIEREVLKTIPNISSAKAIWDSKISRLNKG